MSELITLPRQRYENLSPCCLREEALYEAERIDGHLSVRVCRICRRRHYRMRAEPGRIFGDVQSWNATTHTVNGQRRIRMTARSGAFGAR
jgi:hypothetical protein